MIGTGAALIGSALIGAGASMYGSSKASSQQQKAAQQQLALQQQGLDFQKGVYEEGKNNLAPWMTTGQGANSLLASFYGLNGADPALGAGALARFAESPDYKFALSEGMGALENSASAKGGLLGGNQIRRTVEFGQGLASNNLQSYLTTISNLSRQGQNAATALAGNGANMSGQIGGQYNNMGNTYGNIGQAQAAGTVGMTNAVNSGLNNLMFYNQMGKSSFGGGGSSFGGNPAMAASGGSNLGAWY